VLRAGRGHKRMKGSVLVDNVDGYLPFIPNVFCAFQFRTVDYKRGYRVMQVANTPAATTTVF